MRSQSALNAEVIELQLDFLNVFGKITRYVALSDQNPGHPSTKALRCDNHRSPPFNAAPTAGSSGGNLVAEGRDEAVPGSINRRNSDRKGRCKRPFELKNGALLPKITFNGLAREGSPAWADD
jgi:hypothetical protein